MTDHPINPPPELVQDWAQKAQLLTGDDPVAFAGLLCNKAARWGADQELKACYEWVVRDWTDIQSADMLLATRRPKPLSLKEQALKILEEEPEADDMKELVVFDTDQVEIIRRALEQLDD